MIHGMKPVQMTRAIALEALEAISDSGAGEDSYDLAYSAINKINAIKTNGPKK